LGAKHKASLFNHSSAEMLAVLVPAAAQTAATLLQSLQVQKHLAGTCQAKCQPPALLYQVSFSGFFVFVEQALQVCAKFEQPTSRCCCGAT
jgi:hypothetical protein